jgi:hypothetical protein
VFSERLWSLSPQFGMSRRLAHGADGSNRSNRLPAPSVFDVLYRVSHSHEVIAASR